MRMRTCTLFLMVGAMPLIGIAAPPAVSAVHGDAIAIREAPGLRSASPGLREGDSSASDPAAVGLVEIRTLAPDMVLDIRYATADNFTGARVPGYEAPACYLLEPAARALAQVDADLRKDGALLVIHDCYRPVRAVQAFVAWVHDAGELSRRTLQYPDLEKPQLLEQGYIAERSGHSRGATVDLALLECPADADAGAGADACEAVDMGTAFDFFGPRAHTNASGLTAAQRAHRARLVAAMARRGFVNYPKEWWHFSLHPAPGSGAAFDVPVVEPTAKPAAAPASAPASEPASERARVVVKFSWTPR